MSDFEKNVFVNCPFDSDYRPILRPLIFTILYLGLKPRIAFERFDSGELRLSKIVQLIRESKFGIHDLSRCQAGEAGEFFRLNMPYELGVDSGCRLFRSGKWRGKKSLILETRRYRYQKALSDLAGADIRSHGDDPIKAIAAVRDWLVHEARADARPYSEIRSRYEDFVAQDFERLTGDGYKKRDIYGLPMNEVALAMARWVKRARK